MKRNLLLYIFLLTPVIIFSQEWSVREFGSSPDGLETYDIIVADGRNINQNNVYVTTRNGGVYEWSFNGSTWSYTTILSGPLVNIISLRDGKIKNDGINRIYIAEWSPSNSVVLEATFSGGNWSTTQIGTEPSQVTGIFIGDGRDDGIDRLYVTGIFGLKEYTWNGNSWDIITVLTGVISEGVGEAGDGRNDGVNRLYTDMDFVAEQTWTGSSFSSSSLSATAQWPECLVIGQARNDGVNRVYAKTGGGRLELTYNGGGWDVVSVSDSTKRGDILVARVKSDGLYRVYSNICQGWQTETGEFYEHSWNGNSYNQDMIVDAVSGATGSIITGNGRNDDTIRIYVPHYTAKTIYEITNTSPFVLSFNISTLGDTTFCEGGNVDLQAPSLTNATYQWKKDGIDVGANSNTYTANLSGSYTLERTTEYGTTQSGNSIQVTVNPIPSKPSVVHTGNNYLQCTETGDNYTWYLNSGLLPDNTQTILATQSGTYQVIVTINGCDSEISDGYNHILTSLENIIEEKIKIFNNYAQDLIFISNHYFVPYNLEIYDIYGKLVFRQYVKSTGYGVNTKRFSRGIYTIKIYNKKEVYSQKVIIKRI